MAGFLLDAFPLVYIIFFSFIYEKFSSTSSCKKFVEADIIFVHCSAKTQQA